MQNDNLKLKIFKIKSFFVYFIILFIIHYYLLIINSVYSVCPLCTVAVGAGVGLCRFLGIDDTISGVWVGGLIFSLGFWLADFLKKRRITFPYLNFLSVSFLFLITILFLYWQKLIGIKGNSLWGIDKIFLGIVSGSLVFFLGILTDKILRKKNNGKVYIYYQKVIIPILYLTILSLVFYKLTC